MLAKVVEENLGLLKRGMANLIDQRRLTSVTIDMTSVNGDDITP
jgi:hypothetical protein